MPVKTIIGRIPLSMNIVRWITLGINGLFMVSHLPFALT